MRRDILRSIFCFSFGLPQIVYRRRLKSVSSSCPRYIGLFGLSVTSCWNHLPSLRWNSLKHDLTHWKSRSGTQAHSRCRSDHACMHGQKRADHRVTLRTGEGGAISVQTSGNSTPVAHSGDEGWKPLFRPSRQWGSYKRLDQRPSEPCLNRKWLEVCRGQLFPVVRNIQILDQLLYIP